MNWLKYFWWLSGLIVLVVLLLGVFPGKIILPQSFNIGSWQIHYYGLIISLAVWTAWLYLNKDRDRLKLPQSQLENLFIVVFVSGFLGARIYHVATDWHYYSTHASEIGMVWQGGLGIFGAILGGLIGLYVYNQVYLRRRLLELLDYLVPALLIGQIIGRIGNLFNYELYGLPTSLPWKMFVPENFRVTGFESWSHFHPLFLYESLAGLLILWVLLRYNDLAQRFGLPNRSGARFAVWLILYGLLRIGIETLRIESSYLGNIPLNFLVSGLAIVVGLCILLVKNNETTSS